MCEIKYQLSDLFVVAELGGEILLLVKPEDVDNPKARALQIILPTQQHHIEYIGRLLKFTPFTHVYSKNKSLQLYYKDQICRYLSDEKIVIMLIEFGNDNGEIAENPAI